MENITLTTWEQFFVLDELHAIEYSHVTEYIFFINKENELLIYYIKVCYSS